MVLQNVGFPADSGDAMSFDECLQLLAETFPVEESEVRTQEFQVPVPSSAGLHDNNNKITIFLACQNTSVSLNTAEVAPMMSPELPAGPSTTQSPDPLSGSPAQAMCPELEEAWMELLSLPELQV